MSNATTVQETNYALLIMHYMGVHDARSNTSMLAAIIAWIRVMGGMKGVRNHNYLRLANPTAHYGPYGSRWLTWEKVINFRTDDASAQAVVKYLKANRQYDMFMNVSVHGAPKLQDFFTELVKAGWMGKEGVLGTTAQGFYAALVKQFNTIKSITWTNPTTKKTTTTKKIVWPDPPVAIQPPKGIVNMNYLHGWDAIEFYHGREHFYSSSNAGEKLVG